MLAIWGRGRPVGALLLVSSLIGCATVSKMLEGTFEEPQVEFQKLHLRDLSFEDLTMDFEFLVTNPNKVGIKLASLDYALEMDGKSLAKGESNQALALKAQGSAPVRLPLTITFKDFADNLATLFSSRESVPYAIQAGFALDTPVGPLRIPASNKGTVPLPKLPDVKIDGVRLANMGVTGAKVEFAFNVTNRGQFPINPRGLLYNVSIAGASISSGQESLPSMAAQKTERVVIPLNVNFLKLGSAAVSAIRSKSLPYEVKGSLDLGVLAQPFDISGTAKL